MPTSLCRRYVGRTALVTGAASGLGRACARRLAAEGAAIGIIDTQGDLARAASEELERSGANSVSYELDVTDAAGVQSAVEDLVDRYGSVDVLVNMAGVFPALPLDQLSAEKWRQIIDVNLTGTFLTSQAVLPWMRERQYGRIINTSSGTLMLGRATSAAYLASKAGVIGLTRAIAREAGADGVTANVVMPGGFNTEGVRAMITDPELARRIDEQLLREQCVKRLGQPEDIAEAVAYLASEGAAFVTGETHYVGGGYGFA